MAEAIGWADARFFYEFAITGHPLIGTIADVGICASKANAATRLLNTSTQMPLDHAVSCVRRMFQYAARDGWLDLF